MPRKMLSVAYPRAMPHELFPCLQAYVQLLKLEVSEFSFPNLPWNHNRECGSMMDNSFWEEIFYRASGKVVFFPPKTKGKIRQWSYFWVWLYFCCVKIVMSGAMDPAPMIFLSCIFAKQSKTESWKYMDPG